MSSRRPPSACFVERTDLLNQLLEPDEPPGHEKQSFEPNRSTLSAALSKGSQRTGGSKSQSQYQQQQQQQQSQSKGGSAVVSEQLLRRRQQEEADKRAIEQALQSKKAADDKVLGKLSSRVKASMNFLDGVDRELNLVSESKHIKARRAFEEWNSNVHGKIQQKISESVNNTNAKDLHERRLSEYQTFLDITNRKPAIFRDIVIPSEYDPLEVNRGCIKVKTGTLKDPTHIDAQKAAAECSMLPPSGSHQKQQLCKETLDPRLWAKEKIVGTPFGAFAALMAAREEGVSSTVSSVRGKSNVVFNDFVYPKGEAGVKAVQGEMPRGKPRSRIVYADPSTVYPMNPQMKATLLQIQAPY